ncbi:hypothetical protein JOD43_002822 [Pullulanibacillus pueri]|nr:hypothetical protein [Pullulanibacillus pueri]MBM7682643.1 hypothetical protein [Pullulanibacillus pueri]
MTIDLWAVLKPKTFFILFTCLVKESSDGDETTAKPIDQIIL